MITLKKKKKKVNAQGRHEQAWRKGNGGLWVLAKEDLQFVGLCFAVEEEET